MILAYNRIMFRFLVIRFQAAGFLIGLMIFMTAITVNAVVLWNVPDTTLVHETQAGSDILGGAVKRDESSNDTLYFKFHVDPESDLNTEEYFAAFELYDGDSERLGIGNSMKAWAYSAFFHSDETGETNNQAGYIDLHSLKPEPTTDGAANSFQYPRRGVGVTIVFKIQYVPGEDDLVTVWLNPDLGPGANEAYQPEGLTTRFIANCKFDEIRLRHGGKGGGWNFSDLAIATSFSDFVDASSAWPNVTFGGPDGTRAYNFQSWQKEQGLTASPVRALLQTRDGYLWLGGDDGLARFDGLRFVSFGVPEGIKCGPVSALLEDQRGALWIGSVGNGLCCWQNNRLTTFHRGDGLPAEAISALAEDSDGQLWVGTDAGLVLWHGNRPLPLKAANVFAGHRITALLKDQHGQIWIGAKGVGIFKYVNGEFAALSADGTGELLKDSHCLLMDQTGKLWVGAGEDSVLCRDRGSWRTYRIPHNLAKAYVSALAEELNGTIWAGAASGGLLEWRDGKFSSIPVGTGLAGNLIESMLSDHSGQLWVGTDVGLNRIRHKSLFALSQGEGLGFGAAKGLAEVRPGVVWAAKPTDGLYRWDGKSFGRLFARGLSSRDSQITGLLVTHEGFCWVSTTNSLLLYKDPIAAADEVRVIADAKPNVISLAESRDGTLWLGTEDGKLWELREARWTEQTNLPPSGAITAMAADTDGCLWVGTEENGLYRVGNNGIQHLARHEGLPREAISTLYLDSAGVLWIGSAGEGLSRWRNGHIDRFSVAQGLPADISQILEDDSGRLWLGSKTGIACISKQRLDDLVSGKVPVVYPQLFGRTEGMLSEECSGGFSPAGLKMKSGLLWFSTLKGVVVVDPFVQPVAVRMPTTMLEEVLVDRAPDPMFHGSNPQRAAGDLSSPNEKFQDETLRITPGRHQVEFLYTGLNSDVPEQIRFRYRLDGLDNDWVEAGTRRAAFYSYLPPGDYRFRLAACNGDGIWTNNTSELKLSVLRHFWQSWWFITLAALSLLALVAATVRIVEKKKLSSRLKLLEQERALERERTRIAQDLHDEMGAKLCRISFLSEHTRRGQLQPSELKDQITSISDASRELLHSLDEIVWAVNPQNDTSEHVASYISQYAQDYFQVTGIQCELDIPAQLPSYPLSSQIRHQLFLAVHEALTNILKHSGATQAKVSMAFKNESLEINIFDNGKGFDAGAKLADAGLGSGLSGDGLINMRKRLENLGGSCQIDSTPGRGTQICFVIPLSFAKKVP